MKKRGLLLFIIIVLIFVCGSAAVNRMSYDKDLLIKAVDDYTVSLHSGYKTDKTVVIPAPMIFKIKSEKDGLVKVYGDFTVHGYELKGTVLEDESGGENKGVLYLRKSDEGYAAEDFDWVGDGTYYLKDIKRICGLNIPLMIKYLDQNQEKREKVRAEYIREYVNEKGLDVDSYKDSDHDAVMLY